MSIKRRIALVSASAVAITVFLVSTAIYFGARSQILGPIDDNLGERALASAEIPTFALSGIYEVRPDGTIRGRGPRLPRDLEAAFGRFAPEFDATYVQIIGPSAVVNIGSDALILPPPNPSELAGGEVTFRSAWVGGTHMRIAAVEMSEDQLVVQVGRPLSEADESLHRLALLLAAVGALGILLAGGLGLVVARSAVKPISDLEESIAGIAESRDLDARLELEGDDEVAHLAMAFNAMLSELQSARAQQTRLVRDAGHELRTPLTALRTNLELLQRHEVPVDERRRMLDAASAEVLELSTLVGEVVDLATDRYEDEPISQVLLAEIVESVAERQRRRNDREVLVVADDSVVEGKPAAIERAIANIVSNAHKFSPPTVPIAVEVSSGTVKVTDQGNGFSDDDLPHVFERFYRSADARSTTGSGLGLSIVEQIVADHGGAVFARNGLDGSGTEVGFTLPIVPPDHSESS
jgi:two-component system sensor histidine kinase MprB